MAMADFQKQVMAPMTMLDLNGTARLRLMLLPNPDGVTDIRLLDANRFRKHIREGGMLLSRQQMERLHAQVFSTKPEIEALLEDMEADTGKWTRGKMEVVTPPIAVLSYAWIQPDDPDPYRQQMQLLALVLQWLEAQRIAQARNEGGTEDFGQRSGRLGVMIDFASLHQVEGEQRAPREQASFDRALRNVGALYAHTRTLVLRITNTPVVRPERVFSMKGGGSWKVLKKSVASDPEREYHRRAWTALERRLADLAAREEYSLDLSLWEEVDADLRASFELAAGSEKGGAEDEDELVEQLQAESRLFSVFSTQRNPVLRVLCAGAGRSVPVSAQDFAEEATALVCGNPADHAVLCGIYAWAAEAVSVWRTELAFARALTEEEHAQLARSLPRYAALRTLSFSHTAVSAAQLAKLAEAVAAQGEMHVRALHVRDEAVGAAGAEAVGAWLRASGRVRALTLQRCALGEAGCKALARALHGSGGAGRGGSGVAGELEEVSLAGEELGGAYGQSLGSLFPAFAGTMPALLALSLGACRLGDGGCECLARALAKGAMPRLEELRLGGVGMGAVGCGELAGAVHARGSGLGSRLRVLDLARNAIGDAGVSALLKGGEEQPAPAQVLSALQVLGLERCEGRADGGKEAEGGVGEQGWEEVERVLREGGMVKLRELVVSKEVGGKRPGLSEVMRARGGRVEQRQ